MAAPCLHRSAAAARGGGNRLATDCHQRDRHGTGCACHAEPAPADACTPPGCCRPTPASGTSRAGCTRRSGTCRSSPRTGTSTPGCWSTTSRSPTRPACCCSPTTTSPGCCTPTGVAAGRPRGRRGPAARAARPARPGGCCARNWRVFRGTPVRYWFDSELARHLRGHRSARRADNADALYDQIAERLADRTLPAAGAARPVRHRGDGHHRRSRATTWPRTPRSPRTRPSRPGDPDLPPRPVPGAGAGPAGSTRSKASAPPRGSTSASTPGTSRRWRSGAGTSSRTAPPPPTTATSTPAPSRWTPPRRNASTTRR